MTSSQLLRCALVGILAVTLCIPVAAQSQSQLELQYDAVQSLLVIRYLGLTREQAPQVAALSREAVKAKADRKAQLDAAHKEGSATLTAIINALVAAVPAGAEAREKADQIIEQYRLTEDACDAVVVATTARMLELLTEDQRRLIETEDQTHQREAASVGTSMVPPEEYIAQELEVVRNLRRNEYDVVRVLLARDMAQTLVTALDLDVEEARPLAQHLLEVMDEVMSWSNARFADQYADLPDLIAEEFDLPEPPQPIPPRLTLQRIDEFLCHQSTAGLLERLQFPEQPPPPPALYALADPDLFTPAERLREDTDRRHNIEKLIDSADLVSALNYLDLSAEQLAAIDRSIRQLHTDYDTQRKQWQAVLVRHKDTLGGATTVLLKSEPLTEQQADALMEIHAVEGEAAFGILGSAAERLREIQEALDNDQNMLIDWRAPLAAIYGERAEDKVDKLLEIAAGVTDFVDLFQEIRYIEPIAYQAGADRRAADFLRRHTEVRGRGFDAALHYMIDTMNDVREYPEAQWSETAASMFAVDAMIELRLLPPRPGLGNAVTGGANARFNWWDIERMVSDPLILDLSKRIQEAEAAAQQ